MRLHRNLCLAVVEGIYHIFIENQYADKVVYQMLKRDKRWGSADRKFIAETTYDVVRWQRLYASIAEVNMPFTRENIWRLLSVWLVLKGIKLPDWPQFTDTPTRRIKGKFDEYSKQRAIIQSIPDWLDEMGASELGDKVWGKELEAQNEKAKVILRTNTLKTNRKDLKLKLESEGIESNELKSYPNALELLERANVFQTEAFKDGWFEVQDASSQLVADYLEVEPGMRVIDACAGAGGKTLHLACNMENKGQLLALDLYKSKLNQLKTRAKRNEAHNIETRIIDSTKVIKKLKESADRLLLDAPCSGIGVLKRNPDAKWKLSPEFVENIKKTQQEILTSYSRMLKPGGLMVYSTCSVLPSENQNQVQKFLSSEAGQNFELQKEQSLFAYKCGYDGFYMAQIKRKE